MRHLSIVLSDIQKNELLDISMKSFKEAGLAQALRDEYSWWEKLIGYYPSRVERIQGLEFRITID